MTSRAEWKSLAFVVVFVVVVIYGVGAFTDERYV